MNNGKAPASSSARPPMDLRPGRSPGGPMGARMNAEKPKNAKKTVFRLLGYIGRSKILLIALIGLMAVVTVTDLLGPMFQQMAIDTITMHEDGSVTVNFEAMLGCLGLMAVFFAVSAALSYVQGLVSAKLSQTTVYSMRRDLFSHLSRLPISYTDSHRHGDLMSRMTNDVENVSNAVSQSITTLLSSIITIVGAVSMMLRYSPLMTLVAFVSIPLTVFVSSFLAKFTRKYFVAQQKLLGRMNGQVEETVISYRTVVAYGKEDESVAAFAETSNGLRAAAIRARIFGSVMGPIMNFIGNLQYVLMAAVGGFLVLSGSGMTVGTIQAMLQYSKKFSHPINQVANQYSAIMTALAGAERIFEIMDTPPEIDEGKNPLPVSEIRGRIEFRDIEFGYTEGQTVLSGFHMTVEPGQKIAIVGATGSGKTTVVNLLTRFYEPRAGEILIDGVPIADLPKETLRHAIAIVLQDTVLFSETIRANIMYGRDGASDEDMQRAARHARAAGFIERLPKGYETKLAEAGENLSQGQRQLLSIARAILADPKILILDEATSSVDTRTEMHIQQAMLHLMKNRTSLIIAHRLSTIRDADCIVVVKDGKIAESGNHEELLALGGEYSKLYQNQFAGVST